MNTSSRVPTYPIQKLIRPVSIAPLVTFRIAFGLLMFLSMLRFWYNGWISSLYVKPRFHFSYPGFGWVKSLGDPGMHLLFASIALAALMIALGLFYRFAAIWFFAAFAYVELIDVSTYLNHYYFISLVAFLLIWLPAGRFYALDVYFRPKIRKTEVPLICIGMLRFQMSLVYIFAGLAKLNPDWLFKALPLSIWLPAKSHLPLIGPYLYHPFTAYLFSWFGAAYDLFIVFFLLSARVRPVAYAFVLLFHGCTALFFPAIGMFPYIMICCSLIFFSSGFHKKLLEKFPFNGMKQPVSQIPLRPYRYRYPGLMSFGIGVYIMLQVLVPLRSFLYPGHLFWNEEGFRFSWRVMLMEKSGAAYFTVKPKTGTGTYAVNNAEFLTPQQEKMMSTQPDLILQFAHFLAREYAKRGIESPEVYAEIYVSLNGRHSAPFIDPKVDLARQTYSWKPYTWVLPYKP